MSDQKTKKQTRLSRAKGRAHEKNARSKAITKEEREKIKAAHNKLPSGIKLFVGACQLLVKQWKALGGILLVYAVIDLIVMGGSAGTNLSAAKHNLTNLTHGHVSSLAAGFTLFSSMVTATNNASTSGATGAYQVILLLITSVVFIWALRQVYAGQSVHIREAFYSGAYPIVPFIVVLFFIGIQLLPLGIGVSLYTTMASGGILVGLPQHIIALAIFLLLASWTVYMLCASIIALYVVTLPDMTPLKALRSARELVRFRRWVILRKLIFLVLAIAMSGSILLIPVALFITPLATVMFLLLTAVTVGVIHSYIYGLYREML